MDRTRQKYEVYLSNFIRDNHTLEEAIEKYIYLANDGTGNKDGRTAKISKRYYSRTLGSYLRRRDPTLFEIGYQEWRNSK